MQEQKSPIIRNKGKLEINWLKERPKFKGGKKKKKLKNQNCLKWREL